MKPKTKVKKVVSKLPKKNKKQKESKRKNSVKKIILWSLFCIVIGSTITIAFFMYTEKMLVRLPVLIQENPVVTFALGKVEYRECKDCIDKKWKTTQSGTTLKKGYVIKTGKKSVADIRFHDTLAVRIMPQSLFVIDHITINKLQIMLEHGSMYGKFDKLFKNHEIEVKTPTAIAAIRGTELGFKVRKAKSDKKNKPGQKTAEAAEKEYVTTVYALSGITEVYNPKYKKEKILLSYQSEVTVAENSPPGNPKAIKKRETKKIRSILNAIHTEEVLLISNKIHFQVGSAKLLARSYPELDKIAEILGKETFVIRIEGHADSQSSAGLNYVLSVRRARAIRDYLYKKGIPYKRMAVAGYGESKPIASNETEQGRAANRRVEFIIIR